MKKIIITLLVAVLMLSSIVVTALAADEAVTTAAPVLTYKVEGEAGVKAGETFDVSVEIVNNTSAAIYQFNVNFDAEKVSVKEAKGDAKNINTAAGKVIVANDWTNTEVVAAGKIVTVTFTATADVADLAAAGITVTGKAYAANNTEVEVAVATDAPVVDETTTAPSVDVTTEAPVVDTTEAPVVDTTEAPVVDTTEAPETTPAETETQAPTTGDDEPANLTWLWIVIAIVVVAAVAAVVYFFVIKKK